MQVKENRAAMFISSASAMNKKSSQRNKWSEEGVVSAGGTSILQPSHSHNVPRTICDIKYRDNYKLQSE